MSLGFGLLSAQLRPGETSWARAYADTIELSQEAERLGYDSLWTSEHHFIDDGYMPSLAVVSAAIAAATSRIKIGTGVLLAPLHDPLRLAEDAATVQILSDNRFILGLGLGWAGFEFSAFGADLRTRGKDMDEILRILPKAWSGEVFRHDGDSYSYPELPCAPRQMSPFRLSSAAAAEAAIRRAARRADGISQTPRSISSSSKSRGRVTSWPNVGDLTTTSGGFITRSSTLRTTPTRVGSS